MTLSSKTTATLLFLWALWLTAETWALGPASYVHPHDNADQIVPVTVWLTRSADRLLNAETLPSLCGVARLPASAWINSAHPFFLLLPPWAALGLFSVLQRFVAAWFAFRVARDLFRLPPLLAAAAGLLFPLLPCEHGEMRLMHQFNEPGLPLFLWAFAVLPAGRPGRSLLWGAALGVLAGLGMGPVDAMPFLLPAAVVAAALLRRDLSSRRARAGFAGAVAACAHVAAAVKLPTLGSMLGHAAASHRGAWTPVLGLREAAVFQGSGRLRFLLEFWPLALLAVPLLLRVRRWSRPEAVAVLLLGAGLLLGPVLQVAAWQLRDHGVVANALDFTRFNRLAPFALLLAALSGLRNLLERRVPVTGTAAAAALPAAFAFLAGAAAFASWDLKLEHGRRMHAGWTWRGLYGGADVAELARRARAPGADPFRCATAGAYHEYHPLYLVASGLETADGYAVIYPDRYKRFWGQVLRPLNALEPHFKGYFTGWGSRVYLFHSMEPWNESIRAIPFAAWYDLDLLSLANVRYLVAKKPVDDPRLRLLPPAWDDAARDAWAGRPFLEKLSGYLAGRNPGPRQYVYENPDALPRFFLAEGTRVIDSPDALGDAPLDDLRTSVFLLRGDAAGWSDTAPSPETPGLPKLESYSLEHSVLTVTAARPCWMVNTELWYPESRCLVDGRPAPILPAYGAFQAVRLEPGEHRVTWDASPARTP
ncbi:MAG: DUF6044 family protein [Kiritimatiellia bacterium]